MPVSAQIDIAESDCRRALTLSMSISPTPEDAINALNSRLVSCVNYLHRKIAKMERDYQDRINDLDNRIRSIESERRR